MSLTSGHQTFVPRTFRQTKRAKKTKPLLTRKLPRPARPLGALSGLDEARREGRGPQPSVHTHPPPVERVQAPSGARDPQGHDGAAAEAAHRDREQVPEAPGQGAGDSAAGSAEPAGTHGARFQADD